jgi:hypothetical protein
MTKAVAILMNNARMLARGHWFECVSHSYSPPELDGDRLDLSTEPCCCGPLDAPETIAAGACFSAEDPFFNEPYTDMYTIPRWVPDVPVNTTDDRPQVRSI